MKQPDITVPNEPVTETPDSLTQDRAPLPWAIDAAQEFCQKHVDAMHYELAWPALAFLFQLVDDSRLCVPGRDVVLYWRGSVSDLATDLRAAGLSAEQLRELTRFLDSGEQTACVHPPGSRTCPICTLDDADETSSQAVAARALRTRRYSGGADPGRT